MNQAYESLTSLFYQELMCWDNLLGLLEQENQLIRGGQAEALHQLQHSKNVMIEQLQSLGKQHQHLLSQLEIGADDSSLQHFLAQPDTPTEVGDLWSKVRLTGQRCRYQNQINGAAIDLAMAAQVQGMEMLAGHQRRSNLYGADGKAAQASSSHPLARA